MICPRASKSLDDAAYAVSIFGAWLKKTNAYTNILWRITPQSVQRIRRNKRVKKIRFFSPVYCGSAVEWKDHFIFSLSAARLKKPPRFPLCVRSCRIVSLYFFLLLFTFFPRRVDPAEWSIADAAVKRAPLVRRFFSSHGPRDGNSRLGVQRLYAASGDKLRVSNF